MNERERRQLDHWILSGRPERFTRSASTPVPDGIVTSPRPPRGGTRAERRAYIRQQLALVARNFGKEES